MISIYVDTTGSMPEMVKNELSKLKNVVNEVQYIKEIRDIVYCELI